MTRRVPPILGVPAGLTPPLERKEALFSHLNKRWRCFGDSPQSAGRLRAGVGAQFAAPAIAFASASVSDSESTTRPRLSTDTL